MPKAIDLLSTIQVGEIYGISSTSVCRAIYAGHLKAQKVGASWIIQDRDLPHKWLWPRGRGGHKPKSQPTSNPNP